ncbi:MAG: hypothetical protein EB141_16165 [Verrucomicrobia bacterium]|nr:hypothetical protein [Verrucomicrobiota bacterium]
MKAALNEHDGTEDTQEAQGNRYDPVHDRPVREVPEIVHEEQQRSGERMDWPVRRVRGHGLP